MPKPVSKAQARFFGFCVGGGDSKCKGFNLPKLRKQLRGITLKGLPERIKRKKK